MIFKIAFRNIFRQKRRTLITILTMFGGFVLSAVSIGWSDGSYNYIINMFTRNRLGHIQIHGRGYIDKPSLYNSIDNYLSIGHVLLGIKGVESYSPRVYGSGLISVLNKTTGVQIIGIDPSREQKAVNFNKKIIKGVNIPYEASNKVILGRGLALNLKAHPGSQIALVSQGADGSIASAIFEISGIMESGDQSTDRISCYMHIKNAQDFFVLDNRIHEIIVIVNNIADIDEISNIIQKKLNNPELSVLQWKEFAKSFYHAMKADQQGMWIMLMIVIFITAIGVLNTILMSVLERRREYGLLKAIGVTPRQIILLIFYEAAILAVISIVFGIASAFFINYLLSLKGIALPHSFTYGGVEFSKLYTEINARSFYIPAITVFLSSVLVAFFPALRASRTDPAAAMKIF